MATDRDLFSEQDFTPLPGVVLSADAASRVVKSLASAFARRSPVDVAANAPMGNWFIDALVVDETVLDSVVVRTAPHLYLYVEPREFVCQASPEHIRLYLECRNPWESFDSYIFDDEMKWCVWITHHDDVCLIDPKHLFKDLSP